MNPQPITKSKIFNLSSKNSILNNGSMNSNVSIPFPNLVSKSDNVLNVFISVIHAEIPNSFYLVNRNNNTLTINSVKYTIPQGYYNASSIITAIKSVIPAGFTITFSGTLFKYTFNYTSPFTISAKQSTINRILGLSYTTDMVSTVIGSNNYIVFPNIVNFLPISRINFRSPQLSFGNYNQYDNSTDMFLSVQNNGNLGSMVLYNNYSNLKFLYEKDLSDLSILDIRITDDNGEIDLNGQDFYLTLQIDIVYIPSIKDSFSNIIKQIPIQ